MRNIHYKQIPLFRVTIRRLRDSGKLDPQQYAAWVRELDAREAAYHEQKEQLRRKMIRTLNELYV